MEGDYIVYLKEEDYHYVKKYLESSADAVTEIGDYRLLVYHTDRNTLKYFLRCANAERPYKIKKI